VCTDGHAGGIHLLLSDSRVDVNMRDHKRRTPLHRSLQGPVGGVLEIDDDSSETNWGSIIQQLLEAGADASLADSAGRTPSEVIAQAGGVDAILDPSRFAGAQTKLMAIYKDTED